MPVRPPSLRSIAAFEAAARHSSFTKAADELNLTAGAISHAIRALEERLDQKLFVRTGRGVKLTPAGRTLAARVRLSLGLLADAFDILPRQQRLVVSTTGSIARRILLPNLDSLRLACPGVEFDVRCTNALADFDDGVDVAVRFGPGGWRGVHSRFLGDERLFPVVARGYRDGRWPSSEDELAQHRLIHLPESSWRLWLEQDIPDSCGDEPGLYLDDADLVLEVASAGQGIALARGRLARDDLRSGRLVRILERSTPAEYGYWAVWNASSPRRQLIAGFVEAVARLFDDEDSSTQP